ncbi:MAG: hypothetical protein IKS12_01495, partial [Eubacterium sp.]|nr:hypothetical protein [Eubacterium sp.]
MKKTKKILSIILAAFMLFSVMPITAYADEVSDAETVMTNLQNALSGTNVYTGATVKTAYEKYVATQAAIDDYKYGDGTAAAVTTAKNNLQSAINGLTAWSPAQGTATPKYQNDSSSTTYANLGVANLLYSYNGVPKDDNNNKYHINVSSSNPKCTLEMWYSDVTVMLYDGITAPSMPIIAMGKKGGRWDTCRVFKINVVDTTNFQLIGLNGYSSNNQWRGRGNENFTDFKDKNFIDYATNSKNTVYVAGTEAATNSFYTELRYGVTSASWASWCNIVKYKGSSTAGFVTLQPSWIFTVSTSEKPDNSVSVSPSMKVYVVNSKPMNDLIKSKAASMGATFATAKENGATDLVTKYKAATEFNATSYNYSNSANAAASAATAGNATQNLKNDLNGASVTTDTNSGYSKIRTAMDEARATYNSGNTQ